MVDNASTVSVAPVLAPFPFARLIEEPRPGSYRARNAGVRAARGRILAFTDADCRPTPQWLAAALRQFDANPELGPIGGPIELFTEAHPSIAALYEREFSFPQEEFVLKKGFSATANLCVRREVFDEVGEFDDRLLSSGDAEWGRRAGTRGWPLSWVPDMVIRHPARGTRQSLRKKHRRAAGGHVMLRRQEEGRLAALLLCFKPAMPLRRALRKLPRYRAHDLRAWQALAIALLLIELAGVTFLERLRVFCGGAPNRA